ncbi:MAG TPA: invasin domain 3-containing protein [Longimicrobiales bacterium]|nr:invasin domain 3-containing protein [Longimicrobiales bacterium]
MHHLSRVRLFLIALLVASGWACTETLVGVVDVSVVDIAPPSASVFVGESVTLQALAKDDRGNTLNGRPLTWMSENAQIASVDAQGRVTGVAEGITNVIASSEGISRTARVTVLPRPAPAQIAIFSGDDQTAVAGTAVDSALAVRVTDTNAAPVANVAVTFVVTSGGGSLGSGAPVFTNGSGIALSPRWTLGAAAGLNTVRATAAGLPGDSVVFTATATQGAATRLAMTTEPSASALNGSVFQRQPVVQVRDAGGNAVNQAGIAVTATIVGTGTLNGTITVTTDAAGAARFTDLAITGPEGEKRLEFTAPGVTPVTSSIITITTGSGTKLTLLTQPSSSVQNGVVFARQPVVQLQDAGGNAVTQAGVLVTASILSGGGTLNGTRTATTNAAGTATFTDLSMTGTAGDRTLQFTASGIAAATSNTVTLTVGPGSAAQSSATVPGGIAGSATSITITVRDAGQNPVTGEAARLAVAVTGANTASPAVTEIGGGSYRATYTPSVIGTDQIAITLGGTPIGGSPYTSTITASGLSDANSTVIASPSQGVVADGIANATVTITLADPFGNPVTGLSDTNFAILLTGSAEAGVVTASGTPGRYTFTVTDTVAENVTVRVTAGGTQLSQQPTIGFVPGAIDPARSAVVASPASGVAADGITASTVTVTLRDAHGNPVSGLAGAGFSISLTGSATASAVTATGAPGVYSFTVTNTVAETVTVTVTAGGVQLTQTPTIGFFSTGVSAPRSIVVANPATGVTANGTAASTVTVTLRDANDNTLSGVSPASFTIAVTGSAQAGPVSAAAAPGTYTFTVTNTVAETVTVTVTASGVVISQKPTIGFVPGPISASQSTVAASPTSGVTADGADVSTVTVSLKDATGNPIAGVAGSAFTIGVTGSGQAGAVSAGPTAGTYTFPVTNTAVETVTVTVTVNGVQLTQQPAITFGAGGVSAAQSSASASPTSGVTADGVDASTVTVTLQDASGNPISGAALSIGVSGSGQAGTVTAGTVPGSYTFTVSNTVAETVTVTVTANGVQLTQQPTIGFVAGVVSAAQSSVSANPTSGVLADGVAASTVSVTLADANGNPVTGLTDADFTVTLTGSGQASTVSPGGTPGTYTFTVTDPVPETVTVTVTADGVQLAQQPTITFVATGASPSLSTVVASPTSGVTADGVASSIVTVSVRDANNNRMSGLTSADFSITVSGSGTYGAVTQKSGPPGVFEFPVTDTVAETVTVRVTVRGVQLTQQPTITFN